MDGEVSSTSLHGGNAVIYDKCQEEQAGTGLLLWMRTESKQVLLSITGCRCKTEGLL